MEDAQPFADVAAAKELALEQPTPPAAETVGVTATTAAAPVAVGPDPPGSAKLSPVPPFPAEAPSLITAGPGEN